MNFETIEPAYHLLHKNVDALQHQQQLADFRQLLLFSQWEVIGTEASDLLVEKERLPKHLCLISQPKIDLKQEIEQIKSNKNVLDKTNDIHFDKNHQFSVIHKKDTVVTIDFIYRLALQGSGVSKIIFVKLMDVEGMSNVHS